MNFFKNWYDKNLAAQSNDQWLRKLIFGQSQSLIKSQANKNKNKNKKTVKNDNATKVAIPVVKPNTEGNLANLIKAYGGSSGGSGGGGGGVANRIDMTPFINSLREGAAANKKTISDRYAAERNRLSTQLRQYQENTATARRQAMDAFNSARADLEEQSYMNMRAAQQSAASRGLGGSGLQQLAQLSSQIESGKQTSDLSEQNTETQNQLTKALKDVEEQINTAISDANTEERNQITQIDANVAQAIAEAQYNEEVRYQNALAEAAARNAAIASQRSNISTELGSLLSTYDRQMDAALSSANNAFSTVLRNKNNKDVYKNKKAVKSDLGEVYDEYFGTLSSIYGSPDYSGLLGTGREYYDYYSTQLRNAYNSALNRL